MNLEKNDIMTLLFIILVVIMLLSLFTTSPPPSRGPAAVTDHCKNMSVKPKHVSTVIQVPLVVVEGPRGHAHLDLTFTKVTALFFLDTGYAGLPVFNVWHHDREERNAAMVGGRAVWHSLSTEQRLKTCLAEGPSALPHVNDDDMLSHFITAEQCTPYASDCKIRLAGIASDEVRTMDIVQCPMSLRGSHEIDKDDRMVTMNIPGICHILTIDYLISYGTAAITFRPALLQLGPVNLNSWTQLDVLRIHGAFVCRIAVQDMNGHAHDGYFTVDTGSSIPIACSKSFSSGLKLSTSGAQRFVRQRGINNEKTCAKVYNSVQMKLRCANGDLFDIQTPIICNNTETLGVDGYIGLEFLKLFTAVAFTNSGDMFVNIKSGTPKIISDDFLTPITVTACSR